MKIYGLREVTIFGDILIAVENKNYSLHTNYNCF